MESAKKILPFLLVAIVFAVGGYFVGSSKLDNQGASVFSNTVVSSPNGMFVWWNAVTGVCTINYTYNGQPASTTVPVGKDQCRNYVSAQQPVNQKPIIPTASTTVKPSTTIKSQ